MIDKEKFDVFIAYYGDRINGTEAYAEKLYNCINRREIYNGKYINAYFHPITNKHGKFSSTPRIVGRTPMFLLVVDKNIPVDSTGMLREYKDNRIRSDVYQEVEAFRNFVYAQAGEEAAAKLFIADDFDVKSAERLDPIFSGTPSIKTENEVIEWIEHFYKNTYVSIFYERCKIMPEQEFLKGEWVSDAENIWQGLRVEEIGRVLLIYYYTLYTKMEIQSAETNIQRIYNGMLKISIKEQTTRNVLDKVGKMFC